jgi:hypothetical protein
LQPTGRSRRDLVSRSVKDIFSELLIGMATTYWIIPALTGSI